MKARMRELLHRFIAGEDANVATAFGISVVPLVGAIGLAVDVGRTHLVKTRL